MRIEPKPVQAYPWYLKPFLWNQRRKYGQVLAPALLWARSPLLFLAVAAFVGIFERKSSPLPPALRALVMTRISQINWCRFCEDLNAATLLKRGISPAKMEALGQWPNSNLFDADERLVLEYAEAMTRSDLAVDDALMERLKNRFGDDASVELTGLIAFQNMSSKFNSALAVPSQGFCRLPEAAAQPGGQAGT
ncbi:MAG: carboxymuconolactone decarboxylase family protein [Rhodospirillales bacterium]|nr:carboxymuconolactone decarboxylase family protein [Rhodospirillales bacterium]